MRDSDLRQPDDDRLLPLNTPRADQENAQLGTYVPACDSKIPLNSVERLMARRANAAGGLLSQCLQRHAPDWPHAEGATRPNVGNGAGHWTPGFKPEQRGRSGAADKTTCSHQANPPV
jgi:hypothetical protein